MCFHYILGIDGLHILPSSIVLIVLYLEPAQPSNVSDSPTFLYNLHRAVGLEVRIVILQQQRPRHLSLGPPSASSNKVCATAEYCKESIQFPRGKAVD